MFVCSCILLCSSSPEEMSVISLLHVRLSRVIKIILTYLLTYYLRNSADEQMLSLCF